MEHEVEHYSVVSELKADALAREVQEMVKHGWQPWGSVSTMSCGSARYFTQAVVKYAKPKKEAFQQ